MASAKSGVEFEWRRRDGTALARGRCLECGATVERSTAERAIVGFSSESDLARDPQARALLTRAVLSALRESGCAHAMHDRAALADCVLRPDRAKLAAALAALFDVDALAVQEVLRAPSLRVQWATDSVSLSWERGAASAFEHAARSVQQQGSVLSVRVQIAPEEAWELFASRGLVPVEWLAGEGRAYRTHIEQGIVRAEPPPYVNLWRVGRRDVKKTEKGEDLAFACPATVRACVALAADCESAVAVETLVHEVLERLEPWGVQKVRRVSWRVVDASRWRTVRQSYWSESLRATIASVLGSLSFSLPNGYGPTDPIPRPSWWSLAAAESALSRLWDELSIAAVMRPDGLDPALLRDFRRLPNPYEPLLSIWSTGFVFDELLGDEAVLVASEW
jgi:hypothetical protein